ncbi:MAG: hypothetical protein U0234_12295 [Sandaracinus sp.]
MADLPSYPSELARYVEAHWPKGSPLGVSVDELAEALHVAYHASLMQEEARPTRFRLLLTPPDRLPSEGQPNRGVLRLLFERSRPLHPDELRRLAPAVPFETSLIGAHVEEGELRIWGIAHSGPAWLAPTWGGRRIVPNWTYGPIIHVTGPGQLAVRCAGGLVGALERGELVDTRLDVFESRWLPAMFAREREEVRATHAAGATSAVEPSLVGLIGQHLLRRAIQLVRGARHGGMFLVLDAGEGPLPRSLRPKYGFQRDEPTRRYRTLLFQILDAVIAAAEKPSVGWSDFASSKSSELERLENAVFELSRVFANLAAIDGAVVVDKRFGLLGFGVEVSAELPTPEVVWRALDAEGREVREDDVERVGTRHRAAYRFVHDHPGGLAIVISHDGGVTFVASQAGRVVYWEQSVSP